MSRLPAIFADLRRQNRKALMPFVCAGHPAPGDTPQLLHALERGGASVVEIGFPFSDPIADGPVIAAAMHEALQKGVTPASVCAQVAAARAAGLSLGVVAMVSISIVHRVGIPAFVAMAKSAGIDGLIVPDVPLDEAAVLVGPTRDAGLSLSLLVAPTSPPERAAQIAALCSGFVYILARAGITGTGAEVDTAPLAARISQLRQATDLPLAVGFGVSTPKHVHDVVHGAGADAAIVGSALVKRLTAAAASGAGGGGDATVQAAESFVRELCAGLV